MGSLMEGDPIPLNFLILGQSLALDWVLDKFKEIRYFVRLSCEEFEYQFMALLTAIEAGHTQSSKSI